MAQKNLYVEYRKWLPWWGLALDGQKEVQKVLDQYNAQGYHCVQWNWSTWNFALGRWLAVSLVACLTLGFMNYWTGVAFLFEKEVGPPAIPGQNIL